ncbi:hypothetical protein TPENAI_20058 [Tenacibaculum litopenaei]|uniref:relaxase domain-containing protein n=1 Tax=Tenacibaculum litopenaei TaxID=396016 RepID=UPI003895945A
MIRITISSNAKAACSYHQSSLSKQGEYYQETIPAFYQGEMALQLGLQEVTSENFSGLIYKEKLTPLNVENRRVGYDITTLPPKNFSILSALGNDPRLEQALKEANREMMLEAEKLIVAQNNTQTHRYFEATKNGCWAEFHHTIGRPVPHEYKGKRYGLYNL